jgi:NAD(P)-dependent dehydrogenase (short-subunit alcohol dehydrogenase family)
MSSFRLDGKTAIITGGAGGLGRSMVLQYAEAGANVVIASRTLENCEKMAAQVESEGGNALAVSVDITSPESVDNMVEQTVSKFGALDVIVNNAGRWGKGHAAEDTPLDEWNDIIEQNLTGCFICCMSAGRQMLKQGGGKIINISSTAGSKGNPGQLHYSAAKAAVLSLTNNLAMMWSKDNINVNCILPGLIATDELKQYNIIPPKVDKEGNPLPRLTLTPDPENVADLAVFLASPASDMLTGEFYPIRAWMKSERFWQ